MVYFLISRSSHGKRNFADMMKLRILRQKDSPGLSIEARCNQQGPYKGEAGGSWMMELEEW